ncbi:dihydropteroate synthase [Natrarchaeobius chitinivorans]|uniref:Probable bifunctional folylpolyglutamate synthase/dihydropteroate synthase n=1 Tax=Natrarchaeobius chitinivorans TaxID=1679083 RepID=A0A3N6MJF4_NATCH|nr:dihydropteroate synthase [Natrarchaeobius chitinivorans]RQG97210.1 dihydropteroate synthase [Natrarchaeobius chitinivorans]
MEYHEATAFLFGLRRFRPKPGTESTKRLLSHLEDPHESIDFVQIAGSNGKGSTARMLERTLREAGLSVGLYTSPHLTDVRERVRVDGRKIPQSALCEYVDSVHEYVRARGAEGESPTFFEAMTGLALWHFGREDVDVAVLEVGIGGRFDATSVVDPIASAVTSVTLEHTGIIGDTEREIARDKAHVAPADAPLVTGVSGPPLEAIRDVAGDVVTVGADAIDAEGTRPDVRVSYEGRTNHTEAAVSIDRDDWGLEATIPLLGSHQAENAGIAAVLSRHVAAVTDAELARGLRNAHWPGRFEVMRTDPLVILDSAHNPGACEQLGETLATYDYDDLRVVFGAMHDKDICGMAAALPTPDSLIATEPSLDRAENSDVLARVFEDAGSREIRTNPSVSDALATALEEADREDCVLVTGSLFAVAEARSRWSATGIPKRIRNLDDARDTLERADVDSTDVDRIERSGVHRIVKTDVHHRQASRLKRELERLGGECVLSGGSRGERTDAVLMGTLAQFRRLVERLESEALSRGSGLRETARILRETLEIDSDDADPNSTLPWHDRTAVMGILNVTPDSFHDGGEYDSVAEAVSRAEAMIDAGVDVLDVGGESTRPGAEPVSIDEEIDRVVPVVEALADLDVPISIDTRKAAVAEAALEAGAEIVNDVSGLEDPDMRFVAAEHDAVLVVMHSIDAPVVPDRKITYDDVVEDVIDELTERILLAEKAGLDRDRIVVDPGLGFGKSARESFEMLGRLEEFRALGCPILVGHSHKSMFDHVGCGSDDRLEATVAASALAADRGVDIVRVHDVPETVAAVRTALSARDPERFDWRP